MFVAIVLDAMEDDQALTINEGDDPMMFRSIAEIQDLKDDHSLMACDWWAFDCETGKSTMLD
jgi:hypothetical protein